MGISHRCLQRHGIGRLPYIPGDKPAKKRFAPYPIDFFHIDIAEILAVEGKLHRLGATDRTGDLAAYEFICKAWPGQPRPFDLNVLDQMPGPND